MAENDEQKALASELDFRRKARDAALDAETKHDPSNGQFTSGGGSGGGAKTAFTRSAERTKSPMTLPGMDPGRAKAIAGGAPMNAREISQMRNIKR